jgi:Domain of unknown function (DUF4132)
VKILPWRRAPNAGQALVDEIKQRAGNSSTSQRDAVIVEVLDAAPEQDCRAALKLLLADPKWLMPEYYWDRPVNALLKSPHIRRAMADPEVAQRCASVIIETHKRHPTYGFAMVERFGKILLIAVETVPDAQLPAAADVLLTLADYTNQLKPTRMVGLTVPPQPPPRCLLEAIGVLQQRSPALAWQLVRRLSQGPSSLAKVLRRIQTLPANATSLAVDADAVLRFVELAGDLKGNPTKAWLQRWNNVRAAAGPGMREALFALALDGEVTPDLTYGGSNTDIPRAAIIALSSWNDPETRAFLRKTILNWARSGVGSPAAGTAAVWSLASFRDRNAIAAMLDIRRRIHHKNLLKRLNQEIDRLGQELDVNPEDIADESVDDCGLDAAGSREWKMGDYTVSLKLGAQGGIGRVVVRGDREVKDVPAAVRKEHAETWSEITATAKLVKETVSAQRQRLEAAMVDGRQWELAQWDRVFRANPILANLARRLVWQAQSAEETVLAICMPDGWSGHDIDRIPVGATLSIVHPVAMSPAEQSYWQHRIVSEQIVQPFKQVFRETYFVTPAEVHDEDRSHRFSGHVIPNQMMYALAKGRGWSGTMGLSGFDGAGVGSREFASWGVRATIEEASGQGDFSTIAEVSFLRRDEKGLWWRARIDQIPPIPFSEAMRDIDLVVAVASIGTDQQWLDWEARREAGAVDWTEQQRAYAGLATAASAVRGQFVNEMIPRLGLSDRVKVEGHFVHVHGRRADYRIHLGSGNIHMEPSGRYLCIVPIVGDERTIYLPFEDSDLKSAEVLSKILMLVRDDKISDPVITKQLPYGAR